jgi:predicted XRE-type DNA-binding protein
MDSHGALPSRGQCQQGSAMTIDTEIRHVMKANRNLFLDLDFSAAQAKILQAASRKQINDTRVLKQQLMAELSNCLTEHRLEQADAAQVLKVSRQRVSDVVNPKTSKFTIDTLVERLNRVGKPVRLAVGS